MDTVILIAASALQATLIAVSICVPAALLLRRGVGEVEALGAGMVASALAGWVTFFVYWLHPWLGVGFKAIIWVCLAASTIWAWRVLQRNELAIAITPLAIVPVAVGFLTFAFIGTELEHVLGAATHRFTHPLPSDNQIPLVFATYLETGSVPTPMFGDWQASDRPPLQVGMYLLYGMPVLHWSPAFVYQLASTTFQLFALLGAYVLMRGFDERRGVCLATVVLIAFTPLVIVHGVFVWPKLLPAGILCVLAAVYFSPRYDALRTRSDAGALAGAAAALALGAHGATAFALLAFAFCALLLWRIPHWRFALAGFATFTVLTLPWVLYQEFVDPPGNRLAKWHLAGVIPIDERSVVETIRDSFSATSWSEWLRGRVDNIKMVLGSPFTQVLEKLRVLLTIVPPTRTETLRSNDFLVWSYGLGAFAPVVWALPLLLLAPRTRPLLATVVVGVLVWILAMFTPSSTLTHQGSFFWQIGLLVSLGLLMSRSRGAIQLLLVALVLQIALAVVTYGFN